MTAQSQGVRAASVAEWPQHLRTLVRVSRKVGTVGAHRRRPLVVIHQPGHVGSNTVAKTIESAPAHRAVFHVHRLTRQRWDSAASYEIDEFLVRHLMKRSTFSWDVITLVRNPIERNVSALLRRVTAKARAQGHGDLSTPSIVADFVDEFDQDWVHRENPFVRFVREELEPVWGLVPRRHDYVETTESRRLLTLRVEDLDSGGAHVLSEFLGCTVRRIESANTSRSGSVAEARRVIEADIKLPGAYIDRMFEPALMTDLYTPAERAATFAKWAREAAG